MGILDWAGNQWNQFQSNNQQQDQGYTDPYNQAMLQQQMAMQQQITGQESQVPNPYGYADGMPGVYKGRTVTKKMLLDYIVSDLGATVVVQCDEFETRNTRHICQGSNNIQILPVRVYNVPTPNGLVPVEVIWCENCRKLIVNRSSLELI